jgi:hypothetical protein
MESDIDLNSTKTPNFTAKVNQTSRIEQKFIDEQQDKVRKFLKEKLDANLSFFDTT